MDEDAELPENLTLNEGTIGFEEYVRWSQGASWSEQLLVRDERDREARRLARLYGTLGAGSVR